MLFCLIREEIRNSVGAHSGRIKRAEELPLHVFRQASALATALDHLVSDLLGGGRHQIMRFQSQFREETGQGLFAEIAFEVLLQGLDCLDEICCGEAYFGGRCILVIRTAITESAADDRSITLLLESKDGIVFRRCEAFDRAGVDA